MKFTSFFYGFLEVANLIIESTTLNLELYFFNSGGKNETE